MTENTPNYEVPLDQDPSVVKVPVNGNWTFFTLALRQVGFMGGVVASLFQFLSARDLKGLFLYLTTHEFVAAVAIVVGFAVTFWAYVREWIHKKKVKLLAMTHPDDVVMVHTSLWMRIKSLFKGSA